jgi:UDP-GlcNAc:undecaprenyl-phosphate GlcNAc-1-phosphate transferase
MNPPESHFFGVGTLFLFLLPAACSVLLTYGMTKVAARIRLTDKPGDAKFHAVETPLGGGVAMFLSLLTLFIFPEMRTGQVYVIVTAASSLTLLGLIDDYRKLPGAYKFVLLVVITLVCSRFELVAKTTRIPPVDLLITVLWMVGISSAFNAIDNIDGLATGVAIIASFFFFVVAWQTNQVVFGGISIALAGSCLGFLVFNFPPAKIFMGDSGSFFLGFVLAAFGVMGKWHSNAVIASTIPILILGLPMFDLFFTVLWRHLHGVTRTLKALLNHCDTDHVSHRLVGLGLRKRQAVILLYLVSASFGISATTLRNAAPTEALLLLLQAFLIATVLILVVTVRARGKQPTDAPAASQESRERDEEED